MKTGNRKWRSAMLSDYKRFHVSSDTRLCLNFHQPSERKTLFYFTLTDAWRVRWLVRPIRSAELFCLITWAAGSPAGAASPVRGPGPAACSGTPRRPWKERGRRRPGAGLPPTAAAPAAAAAAAPAAERPLPRNLATSTAGSRHSSEDQHRAGVIAMSTDYHLINIYIYIYLRKTAIFMVFGNKKQFIRDIISKIYDATIEWVTER